MIISDFMQHLMRDISNSLLDNYQFFTKNRI